MSKPTENPLKRRKLLEFNVDEKYTLKDLESLQSTIAPGRVLFERGAKEEQYEASVEHARTLRDKMDDWSQTLRVDRIKARGNLCEAEWDEKLGMAVLNKRVGTHLATLGVAHNGKECLRVEEMLYLLDTGRLLLHVDGVPISFQRALCLLHEHGDVSSDEYMVFSHLRRAGYIVLRSKLRDSPPCGRFRVSFDVYVELVKGFKRTSPGTPAYVAVVCAFGEAPPTHDTLSALQALAPDSQLLLCIVCEATVTYYQHTQLDMQCP